MKSKLRLLLEEFLPPEQIDQIETRAKELSIRVKVGKPKGKWNRETLAKLLTERGDICRHCNRDSSQAKLTLDHVIPKKMLVEMGLEEFFEDEENLEIICHDCNSAKGSDLDFENPRTIALLEKYLKVMKGRMSGH